MGPPRRESLIFTRGIDDRVSEEVTFGAGTYTGPHGQLRLEEGRAGGAELGACVARALGCLRLSVCVWRWLAGARSGLLLFPRRSAICTEGVVLPPEKLPVGAAEQRCKPHSCSEPTSQVAALLPQLTFARVCVSARVCAHMCVHVCMHVCRSRSYPGTGEWVSETVQTRSHFGRGWHIQAAYMLWRVQRGVSAGRGPAPVDEGMRERGAKGGAVVRSPLPTWAQSLHQSCRRGGAGRARPRASLGGGYSAPALSPVKGAC